MSIFAILVIISISGFSSLPINDDRIIFPDELEIDQIAENIEDLKIDQRSLFDDPNILKFENSTSEEFVIDDEDVDTELEYGDYYQGDILLEDDQMELLKSEPKEGEDDDEFAMRTGHILQYYRWPKNSRGKVIVPYVIANHYSKNRIYF